MIVLSDHFGNLSGYDKKLIFKVITRLIRSDNCHACENHIKDKLNYLWN
jgi:hypothetical protein